MWSGGVRLDNGMIISDRYSKIRLNGVVNHPVFMAPDTEIQPCPVCSLYAEAFAEGTGWIIQTEHCAWTRNSRPSPLFFPDSPNDFTLKKWELRHN